jgi:integrase
MGRKPSVNKQLPPRIRKRKQKSGKVYYYYDTGAKPRKEIPLGQDYTLAIKKWAELEKDKPTGHIVTFSNIADIYTKEVIPTKAPRTQKDNNLQMFFLKHIFGSAPLEEIEPNQIKQYLRWRAKPFKIKKGNEEIEYKGSETQANREKALFSHIWNWSREEGHTTLPNPCAGIKGFTEDERDVYVSDDEFSVVYKKASQPIKDFIDLLYLTGQRPADVLRMSRGDIRDGILHIKQGKTGTAIRMSVEGELKAVIDRIAARGVTSLRLVVAEDGQHLTLSGLRARFKKETGAEFQLRDLRAKAGTDVAEETGDARKAQKQLGHSTITMTETYLRSRGEKVKPTK